MKQVPVYNCQPALVDDEDFERISAYSWRFSKKTGYVITNLKRRADGSRPSITMQRMVMNTQGRLKTDHRDHDKFNNQKLNLRKATATESVQNRRKAPKQALSKFKGVTFITDRPLTKPWKAAIQTNRKSIHIGYFETEGLAAVAYNKEAERRFGEFACLNAV